MQLMQLDACHVDRGVIIPGRDPATAATAANNLNL